MKTRNCRVAVALASTWDSKLTLTKQHKDEIRFWVNQLDAYNERDCFPSQAPIFLDTIYGDASGTGCGSILNNEDITARIFSEPERETSSTWRELANIHYTVHAFLPKLKGRTVRFNCDSQCAVKICKIGSMKPQLHSLAEDIFNICFENKVKLCLNWFPERKIKLLTQFLDSRMISTLMIGESLISFFKS